MRSAAYIMVTCDKCRRNTIRVELQEDGTTDTQTMSLQDRVGLW